MTHPRSNACWRKLPVTDKNKADVVRSGNVFGAVCYLWYPVRLHVFVGRAALTPLWVNI